MNLIKIIAISGVMLVSVEVKAMFVLSSAYWSGCVQGKVESLGQSKGVHSNECKKMNERQKYPVYNFENDALLIIEEGRAYFFQGCSDGGSPANICHDLAKKYYEDTMEIYNKEPIVKKEIK